VTLHALSRGSSKDALKMTPLTLNLRMSTCEGKTGCTVVDFDVRADAALSEAALR